MSSPWPSALASLDDSLAQFHQSLGNLEAAKSVDIAQVIEQLKAAEESAQNVQALISAEMPDASWQSREELEAVLEEIQKRVEARRIEQLRSRLFALATELERGDIVHRRAVRVTELNRLRELAIDELLSQAGSEATPLTLPGPEADQWIPWACSLQDPDDAESIQALRGFAHLDNFVANLEPNMWVVETPPKASPQNQEELEKLKELEAKAQEERRSRLLALATELERGSVVHHRALRVNELNQLRDQAIKELRSQAGLQGTPQTLPGPEPDQWIEWACSLQEPDDAASIQALRDGFPHLDDFVAKLEPDMWVAAGSPAVETPPETERSVGKIHPEQSRRETNGLEEAVVSSGPIPIRLKTATSTGGRDEPDGSSRLAVKATEPVRDFSRPVEPLLSAEAMPETSAAEEGTSDIDSETEEPSGWKKRLLLYAAAAVLVLAVLGIILWMSHRNHTSSPTVKAAEKKVPPALLNRQPIEGAQDKILLTMELCERMNPRSIECWGYVSNQRDKGSDVSLTRADAVDGKGNSFNLSSNGQFDFSTGRRSTIPAGASAKYTITIPDEDRDAQKLTLYLDVNSPRDLEYTFRDIPVAD